MPDILTGPYALTAKGSFLLSDIFNLTNVDIVYEAWGQYKSWAPGRLINAFTTTEQGKGYVVYSKVQQNLDTYFGAVSPVSEAQSLINSSIFAAIRDNSAITAKATSDNGSYLADISDSLATPRGGDASIEKQTEGITVLANILAALSDGTQKTAFAASLTKLGIVYAIPSPDVLSGSNRSHKSFISAAGLNRTLWQGGGVNINIIRFWNLGTTGRRYMRLYNVAVDAAVDYATISPVCVLIADAGQKDEIFCGTGMVFGTGLTVVVTTTLDFANAAPTGVAANECYCYINYTSSPVRLTT